MATLAALAAFGRVVALAYNARRATGVGLEAADCFRWPLMGAVIHAMTHVDRVAGGNWMREREGALRHGHTAACLASARGGVL